MHLLNWDISAYTVTAMVYRPNIEPTACFVLMPFKEPHFEYFNGIIVPAVEEAGLTAVKGDDIYGTAPIIQDIWNLIWKARVVIAEVTGRNANVNYELGMCHALGVPTVLITQDMNDVPFDYKHLRCIVYDTRRVDWQEKLGIAITKTLKAVIAGVDVYEDLRWPYDTQVFQRLKDLPSVVTAEEGTDSVIRGARLVRDACARAFGPHGRNVSTDSTFGDSRFDRSGLRIAGSINSADALQQKGIDHARRLSYEMQSSVGDGTKTAVLLFQSMLEAGQEALKSGVLLRDLVHDMDALVESAAKQIRVYSHIPTQADVNSIARTAAGGDMQVGALVEKAIEQTGQDGVISIVEVNEPDTTLEVREGIYFDRGFLSSKFVTDEGRQIAELKDSYILLCDYRFTSMGPLLPILEQIARLDGTLLIIAQDVEGEALETLAINKQRGTLPSVAVKFPAIQGDRLALLEDIAVSTGGTVVSDSVIVNGLVKVGQLGRARHIEVSKESTLIHEGYANQQSVESRAAALRQQILIANNEYEKDVLKRRLAMLVGRVCEVRVGGASSVDRAERLYKMQTAMSSASLARGSGVTMGGGRSYLEALKSLSGESLARGVISKALREPIRQQIFNARLSPDAVVAEVEQAGDRKVGFDAELRKVSNIEEAGILDATEMCVQALLLAFAHARAILQTGAWDLTVRGKEGR